MPTPPVPLQDLDRNIKITNPDGTPTDFFMEFLQRRGVGQTDSASEIDTLQTEVAALEGRQINTTAPLSGGGDLSADRTLSHNDSGVTPGTYGDATHVAQLTVDGKGHVTAVADVAISGGGSGLSQAQVQGIAELQG